MLDVRKLVLLREVELSQPDLSGSVVGSDLAQGDEQTGMSLLKPRDARCQQPEAHGAEAH